MSKIKVNLSDVSFDQRKLMSVKMSVNLNILIKGKKDQ